MTDQQMNYLAVLEGMALRDTETAEACPTSSTRRAIAQWSIQKLSNVIDELPLTDDSQASTKSKVKELRRRVATIPRKPHASVA